MAALESCHAFHFLLCSHSEPQTEAELKCPGIDYIEITSVEVAYSGQGCSGDVTVSGCGWSELTNVHQLYRDLVDKCNGNTKCLVDDVFDYSYDNCGSQLVTTRDLIRIHYTCVDEFGSTFKPITFLPPPGPTSTSRKTSVGETTATVVPTATTPRPQVEEGQLGTVPIILIIVFSVILLILVIVVVVLIIRHHRLQRIKLEITQEGRTTL